MKDWIMDNVRFGLSIVPIMVKHEQHCFNKDLIGESWICNHFVLPHDICNVMDLYASLEYKCHRDVATSIKLWVNANPKNAFFFQHELSSLEVFGLKFIPNFILDKINVGSRA